MTQTIAKPEFSPDLQAVQQKLTDIGLLPTDHVTGIEDDTTRDAVRSLQRTYGLSPTGEIDLETRAFIDAISCPVTVPPVSPVAPHGGEFVAEFTIPAGNMPWPKTNLTYQIGALPVGWNGRDIVGGINQALAAWSAVTPLTFEQVTSNPDITFSFNGLIPGSNPPVPIPAWANAWTQSNVITFNPGLAYSSQPLPLPAGTRDLTHIVLHEIGHVLAMGHSTNRESVMYPVTQPGLRTLSSDDIEGIQSLYGGRPVPVPGWFGANTAAADIAVADLSGTGTLDVIVGHVDNPDGPNQAYYRVGWQLDPIANPALGWSAITPIGGPLGHENQGMGLAIGDITGNGRPDLLAVFMDAPTGDNNAFYRIGFDLDTSGLTSNWSADIPVPGWFGTESSGLAAALWDLDGSGQLDLIVAWIDNPGGGNRIWYRIGRNLDTNGIAASWTNQLEGPQAVGDDSSGLGIALTDFAGNGLPDMALFWIDNPNGPNNGRMGFGEDIDDTGVPRRGWTPYRVIPGWWGNTSTGAGAALAQLKGLTRPDLLVLNLDDPDEENHAFYRILAPTLPSWNPVRQIAPVGNAPPANIARVAAVTPSVDVSVVGLRSNVAPFNVITATWDKVDLNENAGSDIIEFNRPAGGAIGPARNDSAVAVAARIPTQVDAFWTGTDDLLRTSWASGLGVANNTGPVWQPPFAPGGSTRARANSPLAAASINQDHIEAFYLGPEDEIMGQRWNQATGWAAAVRLYGPGWTRPTNALTAVRRRDRIYLFWSDGDERIWMGSVNDQDVWWNPIQPIAPRGSIAANSKIAAVATSDDQIDIFWLDPGFRVMSSFGGDTGSAWAVPFEIGGGHVADSLSSISAVQISRSGLQVFWEEPDQAIWSCFWSPRPDGSAPPWTVPVRVTPPGTLQQGTDIAAVTRDRGYVRVYFVDATGTAAETWWGTGP